VRIERRALGAGSIELEPAGAKRVAARIDSGPIELANDGSVHRARRAKRAVIARRPLHPVVQH